MSLATAARPIAPIHASLPAPYMTIAGDLERRRHRRHDLELQDLPVERWDDMKQAGREIGTIVDLSATGIRLKTASRTLRNETEIRVRLSLPDFAGICPFVDLTNGMSPKKDWTGWVAVTRVAPREDGLFDIAGRLMGMDDIDRAMLGLYLSTQPLAA